MTAQIRRSHGEPIPAKAENRAESRPEGRHEARNDTRDILLRHARRLFAEQGFDGTTVKNVAEAAGVNVSLVSYHFGGKEALYRECLADFGRGRLATVERLLTQADSAEDMKLRLTLMIEEILETHANEPDVSKILHREFDSNAEHIQELFDTVVLRIFATLVRFFAEAQARGILHADFDPRIAVGMLFGGLIQTVRMDGIARTRFGVTIADPAYRSEIARNTVTIFLRGTLARNESSALNREPTRKEIQR